MHIALNCLHHKERNGSHLSCVVYYYIRAIRFELLLFKILILCFAIDNVFIIYCRIDKVYPIEDVQNVLPRNAEEFSAEKPVFI